MGAGLVGLVPQAWPLATRAPVRHTAPAILLIAALIFAVPAAIASHALVQGITREGVPSEV